MNSKTKILIGILVVGIVLIGGWWVWYQLWYLPPPSEIQAPETSQKVSEATITKEQAIAIASQTEEFKEFLKLYPNAKVIIEEVEEGYCTVTSKVAGDDVKIDCNTAYGKESGWIVAYYFGNSWEYSKSTAVRIGIDKSSAIIAKYPKLEYLKDKEYCEENNDCLCAGCCGGCTNFIYEPLIKKQAEDILCYACSCTIDNDCQCINNICVVEK